MSSEEKPKKNGKSQPGNKNALKLTTLELKQKAYKAYCDHLARGKSKRSFYFIDETLSLTWETMEKYIENDPSVFDPIKMKMAESQSFSYWEDVVHASAEGTNPNANTASLQMLMRNKFGWDKPDVHREKSTTYTIEVSPGLSS